MLRSALGRLRWVGVKAASLIHSYGIRAPLQSFLLHGWQHVRRIHHSVELHSFYTNRLYKKCCGRCGRPNIVAVTRCGYCDEALTDEDIRPVGRDVLKELAASRMHHHSQVHLLLDVPSSRPSGHSSERTENGKIHGRLRLPWWRQASAPVTGNSSYSLVGGSGELQRFQEDSRTKNIVRLPPLPNNQQPYIIEYYRSFDFLITQYPFPISAVHLSAVVKGTVYDVKQLRPSHVPLLQRMQRQTAAVVEDILQANLLLQTDEVLRDGQTTSTYMKDERVRDENCGRGGSRRLHVKSSDTAIFEKRFAGSVTHSESSRHGQSKLWRTGDWQGESADFMNKASQKQRAVLVKAIEKLKSCVIFGFTYPCEYNQVNMHAIVPPIFNFNMMKAPFFLPLKKVLQDLQQSGYVQVKEPKAGNTA